jgi:hypothetical protein
VRLPRRSSRQGLALTITGALAALLPTRRLVAHHQLASRAWSSAASCATTSRRETCSPSDCGKRPRIKQGGRYRAWPGEIQVDAVELIPFATITAADVRRAGEPERETLRQRAAYAGPIVEDTLVPVGSTPLFTPACRF